MAMFMSDEAKALLIYEGIGKKENIDSLENCSTRIRVGVNNLDIVNRNLLLEAGAKDIVIVGEDGVQIVMGNKTVPVMEELKKIMK
ncbi:PTS transporter subunit EIIB [Pseudostreptobacillus hongkongensis]|uniref:PTS transporter subunit EIIB n=1 Tax=Pseudostreptobacillus hongkongensis TaxID=1162717 RepID=UPI0028D77576|nr:PTS transporter subunit EIIB [Pseudostreptobacillus hongkongensis]